MRFFTHTYADVSTAELEESDLNLLTITAPCCFAEYPEGAFFYCSFPSWEAEELSEEFREYGLSEKFIAIWKSAVQQGIPYIRFDADGADIKP